MMCRFLYSFPDWSQDLCRCEEEDKWLESRVKEEASDGTRSQREAPEKPKGTTRGYEIYV